jgi:hypothetical protein
LTPNSSFGESVDKAVVTTQETTQEKIIACLKAEPTLTRKLLAHRVGLSEGGVKYHLNKLKGLGFVFFCPPCPPVFLENQRKEKKESLCELCDSSVAGGE